MKKGKLGVAVLVILWQINISVIKAQQPNTDINVSIQPVWGPVGYPRADYYYLPDLECYYSIATRQFIYMDGGRWVFNNKLPQQYAHYNIFNVYKVVVNKPRPYLSFNEDKVQFASYKGHFKEQVLIRDSRHVQTKKDNLHKDVKGDFGP